MSYFLNKSEELKIASSDDVRINTFYDALYHRVSERVYNDRWLIDENEMWWYSVTEYLSDGAMIYRLCANAYIGEWIKKKVLNIAGKSVDEWIGPEFRNHEIPYRGHLETAHICWGVSAVLDLCPSLFTEREEGLIREALLEKGVKLCLKWVEDNSHLGNWRGIMLSGSLVGAVVLEQTSLIENLVKEIGLVMANSFQSDGSYGESLQYGNYLAFALMLSYELLYRYNSAFAKRLDIDYYAKGIEWFVQSYMYHKPLMAGDEAPKPRAVNFNDSSAIFRPSGDLLLHIACRYEGKKDEKINTLAKWLFDKVYLSHPNQGPHELATFGMYNDWGFLTLPLLTYDIPSASPKDLRLDKMRAYSNGNVFIRDGWPGKSILAIQSGSNDGLNVQGHLHGDLNSFIIAYNKERLLIDPGHSCYRNIIHGLESASETHNTCTFLLQEDKLGLQEDLSKSVIKNQKNILPRRTIRDGQLNDPIDRLGRLLYSIREDSISIVGSEVGRSYGSPIKEFYRYWIQIGSHITLVIDRVSAERPILTIWNWVLNNRDNKSEIIYGSSILKLNRPRAGMRIYAIEGGRMTGPVYSYCHDAYHPTPHQQGEGNLGSAQIYRLYDEDYKLKTQKAHIIVCDDVFDINKWDFSQSDIHIVLKGAKDEIKVVASGIKSADTSNPITFTYNMVEYEVDMVRGKIFKKDKKK